MRTRILLSESVYSLEAFSRIQLFFKDIGFENTECADNRYRQILPDDCTTCCFRKKAGKRELGPLNLSLEMVPSLNPSLLRILEDASSK